MTPGIGTVVSGPPGRLTDTKRELLTHEISRLIAEAKRVGLDLDEVIQAIRRGWSQTGVNPSEVGAK